MNQAPNNHVVLEIGSGSYKLHCDGLFSERYESSLGRGLSTDGALSQESFEIAINSLDKKILPFLQANNVDLAKVLVFATAAIRSAMNDPKGSGQKFIAELEQRDFADIKVFSEEMECSYGAMGALEAFPEIDNISILDTGGASHQLVEIQNRKIIKQVSIPIGSHSDFAKVELPDFLEQGFNSTDKLIVIGTSGLIINAVPNINPEMLNELEQDLQTKDIAARRESLKGLIADREVHELFVDYRLQILPNAFKLIYNCAQNLGVQSFLGTKAAAKSYVSKHGFKLLDILKP